MQTRAAALGGPLRESKFVPDHLEPAVAVAPMREGPG
jgi:hypothetical protein